MVFFWNREEKRTYVGDKCICALKFVILMSLKESRIFNPPKTKMKSNCIQDKFIKITSCRGLGIFVNMNQKIEQDERTYSAA